MPAVALSGGASSVTCTDGAKGPSCGSGKWTWSSPTSQASSAGSQTVFVNGKGVVRQGDAMAAHPDGNPCTSSPVNHSPTLSSFSGKVFANGVAMGRVGDVYNSDGHFSHTVASGSSNVFAG
jgi:uncharacterized Zn-binding protein involved in type VI secretion